MPKTPEVPVVNENHAKPDPKIASVAEKAAEASRRAFEAEKRDQPKAQEAARVERYNLLDAARKKAAVYSR